MQFSFQFDVYSTYLLYVKCINFELKFLSTSIFHKEWLRHPEFVSLQRFSVQLMPIKIQYGKERVVWNWKTSFSRELHKPKEAGHYAAWGGIPWLVGPLLTFLCNRSTCSMKHCKSRMWLDKWSGCVQIKL